MEPTEIVALIPELSKADIVFPAGDNIVQTYKSLTPIAREWYQKNRFKSWGLDHFNKLFYSGAKIPPAKKVEDVSEADFSKVRTWVLAAMGSFYPKHEDKEAVCAMLFDTFFEMPDEYKWEEE